MVDEGRRSGERIGHAVTIRTQANIWALLSEQDLGRGRRWAAPVTKSIAGRVRVIAAYNTVVIARRRDRRPDGSGTNTYADTHANAAARIGSAISTAAINPSDASAASPDTASVCHGIRRNAGDTKHGGRGNGDDSSIRHGVPFFRLVK